MDATIEILANPNPLPEGPCYRYPRLPASAEALVQAIRSNSDLEATVPVAEGSGDRCAAIGLGRRLQGHPPVPTARSRSCPRPTVGGGRWATASWGALHPGPPGGSARTLVIMITASEAAFDRAVKAAAPVVESFEFHTR